MSLFTQLWLIWIVLFGVVEGVAVISKSPNATLTSHIIRWASLKNKSKGWLARRGGLIGFFIWLVYHFAIRTDW